MIAVFPRVCGGNLNLSLAREKCMGWTVLLMIFRRTEHQSETIPLEQLHNQAQAIRSTLSSSKEK